MIAGAKYVGKNVVGHDVLGQDDGNPQLYLLGDGGSGKRFPYNCFFCTMSKRNQLDLIAPVLLNINLTLPPSLFSACEFLLVLYYKHNTLISQERENNELRALNRKMEKTQTERAKQYEKKLDTLNKELEALRRRVGPSL